MSFIDGIISGVRSVLGISEHDRDHRTEHHAAAPSGGRVHASVGTTYESPRDTSGDTAARAPSFPGESASDRFAAAAAAAATEPAFEPRDQATDYASPPIPADVTASEPPQAPARPTSNALARIYDASRPGAGGEAAYVGTTPELRAGGSSDAKIAAENVQAAIDYYADTFGRDGIDGAGAGVDVVLNDTSVDEEGKPMFQGNGGYYATPTDTGVSEAIRYGSGNRSTGEYGQLIDQESMLYADDLAIHEYTHGVIRKETGQLGGDENESGATNEGIADVMAAAATRDWRIGEKMYTADSESKLMRNIADPSDPTAVHGLWTSVDQVRAKHAETGKAEEHWASGVISTAAYRVQQQLGGEAGWKAVERVFYGAITGGGLGTMSFQDVARALRTSAASEFGESSAEYRAFDKQLAAGGL